MLLLHNLQLTGMFPNLNKQSNKICYNWTNVVYKTANEFGVILEKRTYNFCFVSSGFYDVAIRVKTKYNMQMWLVIRNGYHLLM